MSIADDFFENEEVLNQQVSIKNGFIVINVSYEYKIDLSRCDTAERLLHWIWHLTEKTWMTNDVMRRFIEITCRENSIEMENA